MVAITNPPVLQGDVYVTKQEGTATTTSTDYAFSVMQDTVHIFNLGYREITVISDGVKKFIDPNDSENFKNATTISISSKSGSIPFRIEGRTRSVGTGGVDDVARQLISDNTNKIGALSEINVHLGDYPKLDVETDDTARIQRAISDLNSKGGGVLNFAGTYLISSTLVIPSNKITLKGQNNAGTIIKARVPMDKMISATGQMRVSIRDIQVNGDLKANIGIYTLNTGMLWMDNVVSQQCLDKGLFLDTGTWMFNLNNVYVLNNANYGIYVGNDCAGSKMNLVVSEENGINLRIGWTRTIQMHMCTFQRFSKYGNVLVQAGWDITFDTCWFEATTKAGLVGETYDLKLEKSLTIGATTYTGHAIRILNNSFHGLWGATGTATKHCILDDYTDTVIQNNGMDGTNGGYTGGKWYENSNAYTSVVGLNNKIYGGQTYTLPKYSLWHTVVGVAPDANSNSDDQLLMINRMRIAERLSIIAQTSDPGYDYDGRLYYSNVSKHLKFASDGRYWNLLQVERLSAAPTTGVWKFGQLVFNSNKTGNQPLGWICITAGTPGVWVPFGGRASNQLDSTATDVTTLKTDFNLLLAKLKSSGLME